MKFNQGAIFSCIDGKLYCDIGEIYELLDHLEGWNHFTHQLPSAMNRQQEYLANCFPEIADLDVDTLGLDAQGIVDWFKKRPKVSVTPNPKQYEGPISSLVEAMEKRND